MNMMLILPANITMAMTLISVALWLPHFNNDAYKAYTYEYMLNPMSSAWLSFSLKLFLVAIISLLFNLDIALPLTIAPSDTMTTQK